MTQPTQRIDTPRNERPVAVVGPERLTVATARGTGNVPYYRSLSERDSRAVKAVVIMLHGRLRDADAYMAAAQQALDAADTSPLQTLLIVPQFLATADIEAHGLGDDMLHWEWTSWMGGDDAAGPHPLSSFDVLDAFVAQLADRTRYPDLSRIVIAGHSGGAQVAHRYAIVAQQETTIAQRFVVANPSSYVYFDSRRPYDNGVLRPADTAACPGINRWKYGIERPPRYPQSVSFNTLETRYVERDVTYLLGEQDCDPRHDALDRSCAANAQGPHRLARGRAYVDYLRERHPGLKHRYFEVAGVGHHGGAMLGSREGVAALFGVERRMSIETIQANGSMD